MVLEEKPRLGTCLCKVKKRKSPYPIISFRIEVLSDDSLAKFFRSEVGCGIERSVSSRAGDGDGIGSNLFGSEAHDRSEPLGRVSHSGWLEPGVSEEEQEEGSVEGPS